MQIKTEIAMNKKVLSLNQWQRMHWAKRKQEKEAWKHQIWAACNGKPQAVKTPAKVVIQSYRKRLLDDDNLAGGVKPLIDALVALKVIPDDNPNEIRLTCEQRKSKGHEMTNVIIKTI